MFGKRRVIMERIVLGAADGGVHPPYLRGAIAGVPHHRRSAKGYLLWTSSFGSFWSASSSFE
jgi:hypothetical protein